jgi:hypothetical protein
MTPAGDGVRPPAWGLGAHPAGGLCEGSVRWARWRREGWLWSGWIGFIDGDGERWVWKEEERGISDQNHVARGCLPSGCHAEYTAAVHMCPTSSSSSLNNQSLVACHSLSRICSVKPPPVCPPLGDVIRDVIRTANRPRQQPARCPDSRWSVEGIPLLAIVGTARVAQAERPPARRAEAELAVLRLLALCAATR